MCKLRRFVLAWNGVLHCYHDSIPPNGQPDKRSPMLLGNFTWGRGQILAVRKGEHKPDVGESVLRSEAAEVLLIKTFVRQLPSLNQLH